MIYKVIIYIVKFFFYVVFWPVVKGKENIPKDGGYIIAANHKSNFDPIFTTIVQKKKAYFLAKEELFSNKLMGKILYLLGARPIKRGRSDISAIKTGIEILKEEKPLTIYPQGTRSKNIDLTKVKTGVALLAVKSKVPVLPIGIKGAYLPFGRIKLTIGKPMYFDEYYSKRLSSDDLKEISSDVMGYIKTLAGE